MSCAGEGAAAFGEEEADEGFRIRPSSPNDPRVSAEEFLRLPSEERLR